MKDIEYLSLYLPYNIQVECQWVEHRAFLHGIEAGGDCCVKIFKVVGDDLIHDSNYYPAGDIKPYLHRLSMLTEEIEHEGERFVPAEKLYGFMKGYDYDLGYEGFVTVLTHMKTDHQPMILLIEMVKYHFDVFNLIQEGKAIDKTVL